MNLKGLIAGVIAGIVGAGVWAAISFYTGYEIAWIAWGIGGLVGIAVVSGSNTPGAAGGLTAALITIVAISGGKYLSVEMAINEIVGDETVYVEETIERIDTDENYVISYIADDIIDALDEDVDIYWPEDYDDEDVKTEYPANYWKQAEEQWGAMSSEDQMAYREGLKSEVETNLQEGLEMWRSEGFSASFAPMDFLFFGLALFTAFKLGSGEE